MKVKLQQIKKEADNKFKKIISLEELEVFEKDYFGRKSGKLTDIMKGLKDLSLKSAEKEKLRIKYPKLIIL